MATHTQIIYHIIFGTKDRRKVLEKSRREDLFRYMWGILKNHDCHLYRVNGVEDHVHILTSVHPSVCLADLVKAVKTGSSTWIREKRVFSHFDHWQEGYGAFTHSMPDRERLIEYIKNQEEHHQQVDFVDEYRKLLQEAEVKFDEKYLA